MNNRIEKWLCIVDELFDAYFIEKDLLGKYFNFNYNELFSNIECDLDAAVNIVSCH